MTPTGWLGSLCALGVVMLSVRDSQAQGWPHGYLPEPPRSGIWATAAG